MWRKALSPCSRARTWRENVFCCPGRKRGGTPSRKALSKMGAIVDDVAVYETTPLGREALRDVWGELEAGKN